MKDKSNNTFQIRPFHPKDVYEYMALTKYIDAETDFLGSSPNDPRPSNMQIIQAHKTGRQIIYLATNKAGLIGHIGAFRRRGHGSRVKHCINVGLGVARDFWGLGIGTALMEAVELHVKPLGIKRMELEVMTHNEGAIALYKKMGFVIEGTKQKSILIGDQWIDEHLMAKLL